MLKFLRIGVIVVVLLYLTLSGGVAVADPPNLGVEADHQYKEDTDDGWGLHVYLSNVSITSVPNMAATAFTREAFVSATATVWVQPLHPNDPPPPGRGVTQRAISLWLEEGCQAKLSGGTVTLNNSSSGGVADSTTSTGATTISPSASENPNPQYAQNLNPGEIVGKHLENKAYPPDKPVPGNYKKPPWVDSGWTNDTLTVWVQNWNVYVNSCAGPVSLRFIGEAVMQTDRSYLEADAFSDIVQV